MRAAAPSAEAVAVAPRRHRVVCPAPAMKATIWGCRGSLATPGPGNRALRRQHVAASTCARRRAGTVVLDAGTGRARRSASRSLADGVEQLDLFLTHLHLDHVEGLGFFAPLFDPECDRDDPRPATRRAVARAVDLRPTSRRRSSRSRSSGSLRGSSSSRCGTSATTIDGLAHHRLRRSAIPGATVGYRLEERRPLARVRARTTSRRSTESRGSRWRPAPTCSSTTRSTRRRSTRRASAGGMLAARDFARLVRTASPRRAVMFHHDPAHSDEQLEQMER